MVKNNIELDVKVKCIEGNTTQAKVAEIVGTTPSYVSRIVNGGDKVVNKTFVSMMEALGYDVELTYVKRERILMKNDEEKEWLAKQNFANSTEDAYTG